MDYVAYKIIHLVGIATLSIGVGGMMAGGETRKWFSAWQGVGLVIMLVSGFGLLAKMKLGFPHFAMAKLALWFVIGMMPLVVRKLKAPRTAAILITMSLVGIMAWLGIVKPALW